MVYEVESDHISFVDKDLKEKFPQLVMVDKNFNNRSPDYYNYDGFIFETDNVEFIDGQKKPKSNKQAFNQSINFFQSNLKDDSYDINKDEDFKMDNVDEQEKQKKMYDLQDGKVTIF